MDEGITTNLDTLREYAARVATSGIKMLARARDEETRAAYAHNRVMLGEPYYKRYRRKGGSYADNDGPAVLLRLP